MVSDKQRKAIHAKLRTTPDSDKFDYMRKNLQKHGLINERMTAQDIATTHKAHFGGTGSLKGHMNPIYKGFWNNKTDKQRQQEWDGKTAKQRFTELRTNATEEWAKKHSKPSWNKLTSIQKRDIVGIESEVARTLNARNRDSTRHGQGNYRTAVPKGDRRSGGQEWVNGKYVNYS